MDANANVGTQEPRKHSVNLEPSRTMAVELDKGFGQRASSFINPSLFHSYIFSQNDRIFSVFTLSFLKFSQNYFFFFWCK